MKKRTFSYLIMVLATAICSISTNAQDILPLGQTSREGWNARGLYFQDYNNPQFNDTSWANENFDDSEWGILTGPLCSGSGLSAYFSSWTENYSGYYLRRHFNLSKLDGEDTYIFTVYNDDAVEIYLNGTLIYSTGDCGSRSFLLNEETKSLLKEGDNLIAVKVWDTGAGEKYIDFGISKAEGFYWESTNTYQHSTTSSFEHEFAAIEGSTISFDWSVSSESGCDYLRVNIVSENGESTSLVNSSGNYSGHIEHAINATGNYKFIATYSKDGSVNSGEDKGRIWNLNLGTPEEIFNNAKEMLESNIALNADKTSPYWLAEAQALIADVNSNTYEGTDMLMMANKMFKATGRINEYIIINMGEAAGTLADRLFVQVSSVTQVHNLVVTGKVNADDLNIIKTMTNLQNADLSGITGIWSIPDAMFNNHKNIETAVLPESVTAIGNDSFRQCSNLQFVRIPSSVTTIGSSAFRDCTELTEVSLPEDLNTISNYTFYGCTKLAEINLPNSLTSIGRDAFYNASSLWGMRSADECIEIPEKVTRIENSAFYNTGIKSVVVPGSITTINSYAFENCRNLKLVDIREGVKNIGYRAFSGCTSLNTLRLPGSLVTTSNSFDGCNSLKDVVCHSVQPAYDTYSNLFPELPEATLYAPLLGINKYKTTENYSHFGNYVALDEPCDINIHDAMTITLPQDMPQEYMPNLLLSQEYSANGYNCYGALTLYGLDDDASATLNVNEYRMIVDPNYEYDQRSASSNYHYRFNNVLINNATITANDVIVRTYNRADKWTYFCFPFNIAVSEISDVFENQVKAIRKYSGINRADGDMANSWIPVGQSEILEAGKGFVMQNPVRYNPSNSYWYSGFELKALDDEKKNNIFVNSDTAIPLEEYEGEETFPKDRSWNFIGNPYPAYFDIRYIDYTAPILVWDNNNNTYNAYVPADGDEYILKPFEGLFCQRPEDTEFISFRKEGRQVDQNMRDFSATEAKVRTINSVVERTLINLTLTDGDIVDRTRVVINESATDVYDIGRDAAKFMSTDSNVPQLFTVADNGARYSINERPLGDATVQLGVQFGKKGTYTIALGKSADVTVVLTDILTGKTINLSEEVDGYTFEASAGLTTSRFVLSIGLDNSANAIAQLTSKAQQRSEAIYAIDGRKVNSIKAAGTYIIKQNESVKKMIVK